MYTHSKKFIIVASIISVFLIFFVAFLLFLSGKRNKKVTITSSPSSANFKIGDIEGKTPAILNLESGKYEIELSKDNYQTIKASFFIAPLKKEIVLNYFLELLPPEIIGTGGSFTLSKEEIDKEINDYKTRFPFASSLPVQTKTYYISAPYDNGTINVYLFRETEEQGKNNVYKWFSDNGVTNPQSLNIKWKYDEL